MTVCALCGRAGTRGFVILSGNGDGTRDSWCCSNTTTCERRQRVQRGSSGRADVPSGDV